MNNNKKTIKILLLILSLAMLTGCTKTLTGEDKKPVKYEETGKELTENVLCRPTDENVVNIYKENNVDIDKLPKCETFKPFSEYEGLWTTIFVKPLAWAIINIGLLLEKIGLGKGLANGFAIVISCLVIRLILYPLTRKTAMQSEKLKEVQPQLEKLEKKYKDRTSEEDQKRKAEEMMAIYSKNKINPLSSCLLSFIQIPLLFAFLEAINRTPVIFENKFLKLDMGTTISHGIMSNLWYAYIIFLLLILATSYFSFRKTLKDQTAMAKQMKGTIYFMLAMILVAAFSLPVALGIYWITSSLFTILQNMLVERKKAKK
ncbi:MAG: YidC/Oxa1 family membrane protein insertase [Bacilli bacterium]|nr:YidC/Oxa1 family membrane protein insertase [Bacilli bacterium]